MNPDYKIISKFSRLESGKNCCILLVSMRLRDQNASCRNIRPPKFELASFLPWSFLAFHSCFIFFCLLASVGLFFKVWQSKEIFMCGQRFWLILFGISAALYVIAMITFRYEWDQSCNGDWGVSNPIPELKNGRGICNVHFELFWKFSQTPLISWKSFYDGEWKNGEKHGRGSNFIFNC